jgi:hypothetical protein
MKQLLRAVVPLVASTTLAACGSGASSALPGAAAAPNADLRLPRIPDWEAEGIAKPACAYAVGKATCLALTVQGIGYQTSPSGLTPADLQTRYRLPSSTNGAGQIVAIVDAYDNPEIASDLATYRSQFNLGTADFTKYNQKGETKHYPKGSSDWGVEEDLDVDMVSAACPKCTIYLVESNSSTFKDLESAEAEAVKLGAHIVSNSWICYGEYTCVNPKDFDVPKVVYLAGSGDYGYGAIGAPSALGSVISVGGTQLVPKGRTYSEKVWDDAGAGCASGVTKPSWQHDKGCTSRTDADISSEAGCSPGVAEYDSYNEGGWIQECGTSASTPFNAAVFGLAGNAETQNAASLFWTLKHRQIERELHYVGRGSDGSCDGSYLCKAGTKQYKTYAGPSGWGTPSGIGAY